MDFEGQREGEEVELVFRKHLMTAWRGLLFLILMSVVGAVPMLILRDNHDMFIFGWRVL